jgi:hypothetical protein
MIDYQDWKNFSLIEALLHAFDSLPRVPRATGIMMLHMASPDLIHHDLHTN